MSKEQSGKFNNSEQNKKEIINFMSTYKELPKSEQNKFNEQYEKISGDTKYSLAAKKAWVTRKKNLLKQKRHNAALKAWQTIRAKKLLVNDPTQNKELVIKNLQRTQVVMEYLNSIGVSDKEVVKQLVKEYLNYCNNKK